MLAIRPTSLAFCFLLFSKCLAEEQPVYASVISEQPGLFEMESLKLLVGLVASPYYGHVMVYMGLYLSFGAY